jgi:hypothetical protein
MKIIKIKVKKNKHKEMKMKSPNWVGPLVVTLCGSMPMPLKEVYRRSRTVEWINLS